MAKWIIDTQSGTILSAKHCVIVDDAELSDEDNLTLDEACSDTEVADVGERRGRPVLDYRDPDDYHIVWTYEDVQEMLNGGVSAKVAQEALHKVGRILVDRSIEEGWVILETLLSMEGYTIHDLAIGD